MPERYILIGADVVPTKNNVELFKTGNIVGLIGEKLTEELRGAEYRIFNLEVPLCDRADPITKLGPHLIAPTAAVNGYSQLGADLLTLANNHILDQGSQGLQSTAEVLNRAGIAYVGIGENCDEAAKPFVFEFAGKKIGVYACAEHEFSIAGRDSAGANPFDPLFSPDHVEELKRRTHFVIVLYHGGKEHYRYPSPNLQRTCQRLVDKGADLVVCQHSHCIGCEEKYENGTIIYGQGNFVFDDSERECWQTGLLVRVAEDFKVSYLPVVKQGCSVRSAEREEGEKILHDFADRSEEIKTSGVIETKYREFADNFLPYYLRALAGNRSVFSRAINKITKGRLLQRYLSKTYCKSNFVAISNFVDCEAHRELLLQGLADHYRKKD